MSSPAGNEDGGFAMHRMGGNNTFTTCSEHKYPGWRKNYEAFERFPLKGKCPDKVGSHTKLEMKQMSALLSQSGMKLKMFGYY